MVAMQRLISGRIAETLLSDGGMACPREDEALLLESVIAAVVKNDDQGSCRLAKRDPGGSTGRDDVAAALVLAAWRQRTPAGDVDRPAV